MRKLKFRAWSEEQNKFIQGYPLGEDQKNGFTVCGISQDGEQETEDDGLVLMQCTGLKDKNGVDVYEGDIIRCADIITSITWSNGSFQMITDESRGESPAIQERLKRFEVIGNIYENKDLLS